MPIASVNLTFSGINIKRITCPTIPDDATFIRRGVIGTLDGQDLKEYNALPGKSARTAYENEKIDAFIKSASGSQVSSWSDYVGDI